MTRPWIYDPYALILVLSLPHWCAQRDYSRIRLDQGPSQTLAGGGFEVVSVLGLEPRTL
jgi:hypothetical protein